MSHPLKIKEFRAYWIGQIISLSGTWMQSIAQSWLVYILTKSAFYLGLVSFLSSFPTLLFTLFGGVIADKYSRRNILIATQAFSALPAVIVGVLIQLNLINIWHIAVASFVLGIATAFDMPARQAFITQIVYQDMITSAVAMQSISFNIARIVGPVLAGFIVAHLNFYMCFYLNALSFLPLILILFSMKENSSMASGSISFKESLKEGLQFILRNRQILYIICFIGILTLFGLSFMTILPIIAGEILKTEVKGLSMIVSSVGVGSLLSGIFIASKKDIKDKLNHIFRASLLLPVGLLGIAFSDNIYITMAFAFLIGVAFVNCVTVSNSFVQNQTEQKLRGRVMSFFIFVFLGFTPIGNFLVGILVDKFGVKSILQVYSIICLIGGMVFLKILPKTHSSKSL